jgi:uncharacterized protein (DUF1697 family)
MAAALEELFEAETKKRWNVSIDFFVRTAQEWEEIIARNPFTEQAQRDPSHLIVVCLRNAPEAKDLQALQAAIRGPETIHGDGRHLYIVYPDGMGRSKLTNTLIERKLATRATARNWNTMVKLAALVSER